MKGLFTILALFIIMLSCKESGVPVSKPSTFVRYFSDGNPNDAVDLLETSDKGFLIISYSKPTGSGSVGWIRLTKTSNSGNLMWETTIKTDNLLYPNTDLKPSNVVAIKDNTGDIGYLIVGTAQNPDFGSRLFIARTESDGTLKDSISLYKKSGDAAAYQSGTGVYLKGRGVAKDPNSNDFFVVAEIVNNDLVTSATKSMYIAQVSPGATLSASDTVFTNSNSFQNYTLDLVNRLYLANSQLHWGGTNVDAGGTHPVFMRSAFNAEPQGANYYPTYPNYSISDYYQGEDISPYDNTNNLFGLIGTHIDPGSSKYDSVLFVLINESNGVAIKKKGYPLSNLTSQRGASICSTDYGWMLLYTEAVDAGGTNTDYALQKIDQSGNPAKEWPTPKTFGGKYLDIGKRVLQSSDGGYVVLGTTVLANVETVFFMKMDGEGNIQ